MTARKAPVPVAEPEAAETPAEPAPETPVSAGEATVTLVYRGLADLVTHGAFEFRPGLPVVVPSELADEFLTYPHQAFEVWKEE